MKKKMLAAIVTAIYVTGFVMALHAALTVRTATGSVAWTVSLISMPFIAVPAYVVFGRNRFEGMAEAFEDRREEFELALEDLKERLDPWAVGTSESVSWYKAVNHLSDFELLGHNHVDLLVNGQATFDSILEGISVAEDYVLFQFYMIHDDGVGRRAKDILIEKAKAGVDIYVLYDEVGSNGLPQAYVDDMLAAGIKVSAFKPTQGWRNRFQLNFRNHRKIVVVDGKVAWVGGNNVGDEYLGLDPDFSPWRDTHVRIEGPSAIQAQLVIVSDWYWATRTIPDLNWTPEPSAGGDHRVMMVPTGPSSSLETASLFFVAALSAARERIWLSTPYFVPDEAVLKALQLAALRGVDVRILTTGKADSLPVYLAGFHYIHQLRDLGIRFYAYRPGFMHGKVMLIDDSISTVGTHNFDNRSFRLNFEVMAVIVDKRFATDVERMFEDDFSHAVPLDPNAWDQKPLWWRVAVRLARLSSPIL